MKAKIIIAILIIAVTSPFIYASPTQQQPTAMQQYNAKMQTMFSQLQNTTNTMQKTINSVTTQLQQTLAQVSQGLMKGLSGMGQAGANMLRLCDPKVFGVGQVTARPAIGPGLCPKLDLALNGGSNIAGMTSTPQILQAANGDDGQLKFSIGTGGGQTWAQTYANVMASTITALNNFADPCHKLDGPMIPRGISGTNSVSGGSNNSGCGASNGTTSSSGSSTNNSNNNSVSSEVLTNGQDYDPIDKTGANRGVVSIKHKDGGSALSDGYCQMMSVHNDMAATAYQNGKAPYSFQPMKDGSFQLDNYTNTAADSTSNTLTNAKPTPNQPFGNKASGDFEAILDPAHPFSPRHSTGWADRTSYVDYAFALFSNETKAGGSGNTGSGGSSSSVTSDTSSFGGKVQDLHPRLKVKV